MQATVQLDAAVNQQPQSGGAAGKTGTEQRGDARFQEHLDKAYGKQPDEVGLPAGDTAAVQTEMASDTQDTFKEIKKQASALRDLPADAMPDMHVSSGEEGAEGNFLPVSGGPSASDGVQDRLLNIILEKTDTEKIPDTKIACVAAAADPENTAAAVSAEIISEDADVTGGEKKLGEKRSRKDEAQPPSAVYMGENIEVQKNASVRADIAAAEAASHSGPSVSEKKEYRRTEKPLISVIDERTQGVLGQENRDAAGSGTMKMQITGSNTAELSLSLAADRGSQASAVHTGRDGGAASSRFASMLSSEIAGNAGEFVRAGSIILRDNNAGSINLVLHPEELGNVRISLKLSDKAVSGHITVASQEAYNAFKNNIDALKEAFAASGFETSGFELSWSGEEDRRGGRQDSQEPDLRKGMAYVSALPDAGINTGPSEKSYSESARYAVNVIA